MVLPNHVWAMDFAFNQAADAQVLRAPMTTDNFTRDASATKVDRSITGDHRVGVLGWDVSRIPDSLSG